ncbi:uncharacterized protein LOC131313187 isoform X2 [Rhododendron vialii]|nr:uncharacterized protein LOC131313187 isoform X2 [Rhododendron vialii]
MSGIQNNKTRNLEKPFPGCLGRMVNLFDLGTGVAANRLLMDKPHRDGSPVPGSQSDGARTSSVVDPEEDKVIVSELRRSFSKKKSNGTPMKMLIDQEMSKEVESKHNSPSVVAKLMGLDALPRQQLNIAAQRSHSRDHSRCHSVIPLSYWQQEDGLDMQIKREIHQCPRQNECKDVYEIWQQSQKRSCVREKSPQKVIHNEYSNAKKMALIRQKFIEAKRLSTDEKLRQSKQFHDALDVLSSNKDLLVKFLQEPNSMFSQQMCDSYPVPPPPENKRITVLRPSKMVDNDKFSGPMKKNEKQVKKASIVGQVIGLDRSNTGSSPPKLRVDDNPTQPTRIVVLKPSPGKPHGLKAVVPPSNLYPRILPSEDFRGEPEDDEARESKEVAEEITRQMRENLGVHRRSETFLSSVFSNGYIGDESSFHKSENDYEMGNCSDSEVITPTSRHSWDYINRYDSPFSSSFSRASYSPESSVCREAKKRLSERWTMMASNGICHEPRHVRRSSSTLGEMLALSDTKKSLISEEEGLNKDQEPSVSTSCSASYLNKYDIGDDSPRNLSRSKSLPVSSTAFGGRLPVDASDPVVGRSDISKEVAKAKSGKSSFKGKVSSLFFPKNKNSNKEKSSASQTEDTFQKCAVSVKSAGKFIVGPSQFADDSGIKECALPKFQGSSSKTLLPDFTEQSIISREAGLSVAKPMLTGNPSESQDQPSPISVLEPPFEDDNLSADSFNVKLDSHGAKLSAQSFKSNLIDKSPPIESIARTLSWDDSYTKYRQKPHSVPQGMEVDEGDWIFFLQSLISAIDLEGELQSDSFLTRWHSPESPLDPFLRDKYIDLHGKEIIIHEAKRRLRRSTRKLVFDCVNAALADITGCGGVLNRNSEDGPPPVLADEVWSRMRKLFSNEVRCVTAGEDCGDSNSLVVERVVRKEVVGNSWDVDMRSERDNVGKEIQGKLLDELVQEAVVELTGKV